MAGSRNPLVSIIIVTFNSQKYIKGCLEAVLKTDYPSFEVVVVDNASTDETIGVIEKNFPEVKIVKSRKNLGYAQANNLGAKKTRGQYVVILNPDTQVSKNWLKPLVQACSKEEVAVCQPKIMLLSRKDLINLTGKTVHFLGFDWLTDYQKKDYRILQRPIVSFSGSAFLIKKKVFEKLGGFDSDFFMYFEDGDLSWRLRLSGYKILLVPNSVVYHDYKFQPEEGYQEAKRKFYLLERNRILTVFKNYSAKTLFLILPAFLFMEVGMLFYFFSRGWWTEKPQAYFWLLKNSTKIFKKRRKIRRIRKLSDREVCLDFVGKIEFREFDNILLRHVGNPFLSLYWKMMRRLI